LIIELCVPQVDNSRLFYVIDITGDVI